MLGDQEWHAGVAAAEAPLGKEGTARDATGLAIAGFICTDPPEGGTPADIVADPPRVVDIVADPEDGKLEVNGTAMPLCVCHL